MPIRRHTLAIAATLLALLATVASASAAPPLRLDPDFGKRGVAEPDLPPEYNSVTFLALSVQPDGAILSARQKGSWGNNFLAYDRYDSAGHPDPSFETKGAYPPIEAVDSNGKVLRANSNSIERYNADGSRDTSYGTDPTNGRPFSEILNFRLEKLLITAGDKLFVIGSDLSHDEREEKVDQIFVVRLDSQGRFDPSFGGDGFVKLREDAGVGGERLVGVAPRGEEGIVLVVDEAAARSYSRDRETPGGSAVVALAADGRPEPGFGEGGAVHSTASVEAFASLPDGGLALAGNSWGGEVRREGVRTSDVYVARLTPAGRYDGDFDGDGIATIDFGGVDFGGAVLAAADGSILVGGSSTELADPNCLRYEGFCRETPVLIRLLANGAPDPGFGEGGRVRLTALTEPYVEPDEGRGVKVLAALPDGGVLAGGGSGTVGFIAKLDGGGALVPGFGSGGLLIERAADAAETRAHAVAIDSRRRILVAGSTTAGALYSRESGTIFRFGPDGRLDRSYGDGDGYVRVPGNTRDIALGQNGDAFVLSGEFAPNLVVHLSPKGAIDRRFGIDGVAQLPELPPVRRDGKRHGREFDPRSIAVLPDGRVLVGGEGGNGTETRIVLTRLNQRGGLDRSFGKRGLAILGLGRTRECNMAQLELRRDGRIVIAGRVREKGEHGRRPALFQVLPDGSPDPAFGRRGVAKVSLRTEGVGLSLAILGDGSVLLGGRLEISGPKRRPLLLRFNRKGRLDRRFARRMLATVPSFSRRDAILAPRQILLTRDGIVLLSPSILAFSRRGAFRGSVPFGPDRKPEHSLVAGAVQAGRPLLVGQVGERRGIVLRRFLTG
ncbi:MAG TPA: hypothetical protein VFU11_06550 [Solirubrobacterales bacterium]|nr:hypothetical protein [Solirubrobacterales bacterium]